MLSLIALTLLEILAPHLVPPPRVLQIVREPIVAGQDAAYSAIEEERAQSAAALGCPHPYFGFESLTGPKEGWWFNGYQSNDEKAQVAEAYAKNTKLMEAFQSTAPRKARVTGKAVEVVATYRADLSSGPAWRPEDARFVVATVTSGNRRVPGTAFVAADGTRVFVSAAASRSDAEKARAKLGPETVVLMARPSWSFGG